MYISQDIAEQLNKIKTTCAQAIHESEAALIDDLKGYPYAAGYSRSALKCVIQDLNYILNSDTV